MRLSEFFTEEEFKKSIEEFITDEDIRNMFKMANMMKDYHMYQYEWLIQHGYSLTDLVKAVDDKDVTKMLKGWLHIMDFSNINDEFERFLDDYIINDDFKNTFKDVDTLSEEDLNQYKWLIMNNYALKDLFTINDAFTNWEYEVGFNGERYATKEEFDHNRD